MRRSRRPRWSQPALSPSAGRVTTTQPGHFGAWPKRRLGGGSGTAQADRWAGSWEVERNGSGLAFVHRTTGECDKADA